MITLLLTVLFVLTLVFYLLKSKYEYWEKRGVPGPKPNLIVGNMGENFLMKKSFFDIYADVYKEYKKYPFVGIYKALTPSLVICDPEVIKEVTVKSFNYFQDNDMETDKNVDPILGRNPFCLKGEEWKIVRSQLTPGFTSGKMKYIYPLLEDSSKRLVKYIAQQESTDGLESKQICSKFTLTNVASCAFGLEAKAYSDEESEFKYIANKFFNFGFIQIVIFFISFLFPQITKLFKIKFVNKDIEDRLHNIVTQTLKYREDNKIIRNDFLQILSQLKTSCKEYEFTDIDVTAHASGFFIDGYETSATAMSFILFDLASTPEIQTKLREELQKNFAENNDMLPYEELQGLPYLDAVISESLRLHPPLFVLVKLCTKSYTYVPKSNDLLKKPVVIEKDTPIIIPLIGFHTDPNHFENPYLYNPERFLGANKENIKKYTYLPFGEGPRACLGQRFGLLQLKAGVAAVIRNFTLSVNKKTQLPIKYDPFGFIASPIGGLWINFEKIA